GCSPRTSYLPGEPVHSLAGLAFTRDGRPAGARERGSAAVGRRPRRGAGPHSVHPVFHLPVLVRVRDAARPAPAPASAHLRRRPPRPDPSGRPLAPGPVPPCPAAPRRTPACATWPARA